MASSHTDPDSGPDSDPDPALDPGESPERSSPVPHDDGRPSTARDDRPRCAGDRASIYPDGVDRNVPVGVADEEVQAVVDHYETVLRRRERSTDRKSRSPLVRLLERIRRWVGW